MLSRLPFVTSLELVEQSKMQSKVTGGNQQEKDCDVVDDVAVEIADTGIVGGKSTNRHGRKTVRNRIKRIHSCQPKRQGTQHRERHINQPQRFGSFGITAFHQYQATE